MNHTKLCLLLLLLLLRCTSAQFINCSQYADYTHLKEMETGVAGPFGAEAAPVSDRSRPMEMEPDSVEDDGPWTPVQNRCKRRDERTSPKTAPSTYSNNLARFKVVAPSPAEGYTRIVAFLVKTRDWKWLQNQIFATSGSCPRGAPKPLRH